MSSLSQDKRVLLAATTVSFLGGILAAKIYNTYSSSSSSTPAPASSSSSSSSTHINLKEDKSIEDILFYWFGGDLNKIIMKNGLLLMVLQINTVWMNIFQNIFVPY